MVYLTDARNTDRHTWAQKQIYDRTIAQINALKNGVDTRPTNGDDPFPPIETFRNFTTFMYDVAAAKNDMLLYMEIENMVSQLQQQFPSYTFIFR